ncbi:DUF5691 domain-containing protein [Streptosporangium sp. NPDC004379]|uniref:DUF5691 domain-containing protein n=1 Tax=Streptosporangium sp. NPDC004379 TaxID=3366189 RepID=UPI0036C46A5C
MNAPPEWEELVSAALVGTDRRPLPGTAAPEVELLERAAVHTVRTRAGRRPLAAEPVDAAPPEERPAVSRPAADRLARILGGEQPRLLPEWLRVAAGHRLRVPPHLLPELLDQAARDRSIRPHLGVLAGNRGRWLAGLNPAWSFLLREPTAPAAAPVPAPASTGVSAGPAGAGVVPGSPGDPQGPVASGGPDEPRRPGGAPDVWELGAPGDRRAFLAALRAADPAAARSLLARGWAKETPDDRAAFLEILADRLSPDDEPFLEAALDDRRREVRQLAADLLTRLPGSQLATRMAARVTGWFAAEDGRIRVTPPVACDAAMERDGVRARPPHGTGERSWWLQQAVARTPLGVWPRLLGHPPGELVRMRIADWGREVTAGWVRAAVLQGDPEWARELFDHDPLADLLAVLPDAERERVAAGFVRRHDLDGQLIMVLGGAAAPWGPELASAVLEKIIEVSGTQPWNLGELTRLAGERVDPALYGEAERLSPEPPVQEVAALLRFRHDMVKELS